MKEVSLLLLFLTNSFRNIECGQIENRLLRTTRINHEAEVANNIILRERIERNRRMEELRRALIKTYKANQLSLFKGYLTITGCCNIGLSVMSLWIYYESSNNHIKGFCASFAIGSALSAIACGTLLSLNQKKLKTIMKFFRLLKENL